MECPTSVSQKQNNMKHAGMKYNANKAVNPDEWLSRNEAERIRLVSEFHRSIGDELPNLRLHAAIHAIVENQIAMDESAVTRTLKRLIKEGLGRHDAVHAIGSVLSNQIFTLISGRSPDGYDSEGYSRELELLTAKKWRKPGR